MMSEKFGCKRNWSWLGFGLATFRGLAFFALVANLVNKWIYGFCAILVGNCHKCIKNEVRKVWLQKELIFVGCGLAKFGGLAFFAMVAKLVNKWSYGFCAIMVGICDKCIKNEVWKVWLQKEFILVGFWLSHVRWIGLFCLGSKNWWISEFMVFVQSWWGIVTNASKMRCEKFGCRRNWSWLVWLSQVRWIGFFCLGSKIGE